MNFNQLNLKNELNRALITLGHNKPTPIQNVSIPYILENKDVFGKSHTGTGKTGAFLLPILNNLDTNLFRNQILIVCPTKDLAVQTLNEIKKYAMYLRNVRTALLIGGSNMRRQIFDLKSSNIVIGTPGRIVDHLNRNTLKLKFLKTIVLDETDEMVKMGFKEQIDNIFAAAPEGIQTLFFSATITKAILKITDTYQNNPVEINLNNELQTEEHKNLKQFYFDTRNNHKDKALIALYKELNPKLSIIFSNTKAYTNKLQDLLKQNDIDSVTITGDKRPREREQAMKLFKSGKVNVLIATDLMARGIHVDGIDYVFNYDIPKEKEYYTHRIGRTARAGATGTAITLVNNRNSYYELKDIEKFQNQTIEKLEINSELLNAEQPNFEKFDQFRNRSDHSRNSNGFRNSNRSRNSDSSRSSRNSNSYGKFNSFNKSKSNLSNYGKFDSYNKSKNSNSKNYGKFNSYNKSKSNSNNYHKNYN